MEVLVIFTTPFPTFPHGGRRQPAVWILFPLGGNRKGGKLKILNIN